MMAHSNSSNSGSSTTTATTGISTTGRDRGGDRDMNIYALEGEEEEGGTSAGGLNLEECPAESTSLLPRAVAVVDLGDCVVVRPGLGLTEDGETYLHSNKQLNTVQ
jgi:hypothetical protein